MGVQDEQRHVSILFEAEKYAFLSGSTAYRIVQQKKMNVTSFSTATTSVRPAMPNA
jgi:hypothetical protein